MNGLETRVQGDSQTTEYQEARGTVEWVLPK